jgi:hypothetical protein
MMRKLFRLLVLLTVCKNGMAQYYLVNDKDGYVNVRSQPGINAPISFKLPDSTIVYESFADDADEKSNWIHVDFYLPAKQKNKHTEDYTPAVMKGYTLYSGYIYKSKITAIEKLPKLQYKQFKNGYSCYNDSVSVKVMIQPFAASGHRIQFHPEYKELYDKIDGRPMIGSDGSKPRDEIREITVTINKTPVAIPPASYKNLFNPSFANDTYSDGKGNVYLVMFNSDGAGSYSCIFHFKNGKFINRLVFTGEC